MQSIIMKLWIIVVSTKMIGKLWTLIAKLFDNQSQILFAQLSYLEAQMPALFLLQEKDDPS